MATEPLDAPLDDDDKSDNSDHELPERDPLMFAMSLPALPSSLAQRAVPKATGRVASSTISVMTRLAGSNTTPISVKESSGVAVPQRASFEMNEDDTSGGLVGRPTGRTKMSASADSLATRMPTTSIGFIVKPAAAKPAAATSASPLTSAASAAEDKDQGTPTNAKRYA